MVRYCGAFGCLANTNTHPDYSFFNLPKNEERRKLWTRLIGREDLLTKECTICYVCSEHFKKDTFVNKRLRHDAVPSENLQTDAEMSGSSKRSSEDEYPPIRLKTSNQHASTQVNNWFEDKETQTPPIFPGDKHVCPTWATKATQTDPVEEYSVCGWTVGATNGVWENQSASEEVDMVEY